MRMERRGRERTGCSLQGTVGSRPTLWTKCGETGVPSTVRQAS